MSVQSDLLSLSIAPPSSDTDSRVGTEVAIDKPLPDANLRSEGGGDDSVVELDSTDESDDDEDDGEVEKLNSNERELPARGVGAGKLSLFAEDSKLNALGPLLPRGV